MAFSANSAPENKPVPLSVTKEKFPDADYFAIFDSTLVDMQETGLSFYREHRLIKILTANGGIQLPQTIALTSSATPTMNCINSSFASFQ